MLGKIIGVLVVACFLNSFAESCDVVEEHCSVPGSEKEIDGTKVYKDCWQYKYQLNCKAQSKNNCNSISPDKCVFVGEECAKQAKEGDLDFCANWLRRFSCEKEIKYTEEKTALKKISKGRDSKELFCNSMCLDGNCDAVKKATTDANDELAQAAGQLNALSEIKKGLHGEVIGSLFNGYSQECSSHPLDFMECCMSSPEGWGEAIGLGQCSSDELNLSKSISEKRCIFIGEYCETKIIKCIDRRKVYCCFDSVIARIIHQTAKAQLGRGYRDPEDPDCSGISLADLERVDLSKADFSDFYTEVIIPQISLPDVKADANAMESHAKKIEEKMSSLPDEKKGYNPNALSNLTQ